MATMYRAYVSQTQDRWLSWIDRAEVTDLVVDGQRLLRDVTSSLRLMPLTDEWHDTEVAALRDQHTALVRHIGGLQAKADELAANILHVDLTSEVPA